MKLRSFHHPDICPTVLRRKTVEEVLDMLTGLSELVLSRGHSFLRPYYESDASYRNAIARLRKKGLVAYRRSGGHNPVLALTPAGLKKTSPCCGHKEPWPSKWKERWYLMVYDVPEKERRYRNVLRKFLESRRVGCLQRSVWITPVDIRAEFDDLVKAGGLDAFAFLFESRSVLGRSPQDIVMTAWDMDRLMRMQQWYLDVFQDNLDRILKEYIPPDTLVNLMRDELSAFITAMDGDPFLPRDLWPADYKGEKVWRLHHAMVHEISQRC